MMCLGQPCLGVAKPEFKADDLQLIRVMFAGETDQSQVCRQTQRLATFDADIYWMHAVELRHKTRV